MLLEFEVGLELDSAEVRGILLYNGVEWGRSVCIVNFCPAWWLKNCAFPLELSLIFWSKTPKLLSCISNDQTMTCRMMQHAEPSRGVYGSESNYARS